MLNYRVFILAIAFCFGVWADASAQLFYTTSGKIHFFSETPLENIEGTSKKTEAAVLMTTGQVSARLQVNTYEFDKSLMKQHFNENYAETDKFPHSSIEGKIADVKALTKVKNGTVTQNVVAKLLLHGVTKEYTIPTQFEMKDGQLVSAKGKFKVKLADHNIEIPKVVFNKIAEVIDIDFDFPLQLKK